MKIDSILMNPYCKLNYSSFYVKGIKDIYGTNAKFSFKEFQNSSVSGQCFLFIVQSGKDRIKFAIDFHDHRTCEYESLKWCDYYAKINLHDQSFEQLKNDFPFEFNELQSKIFSIPPGFGIRCLGFFDTLIFCFKLMRYKKRDATNIIKDALRAYIKRRPLSDYQKGVSEENDVFFIASIWHKVTAYINYPRANFIRACLNTPEIHFEGGFIDIGYEKDYIPDIDTLMYRNQKIPLKQFINKTKKSTIVFNNPSVAYCHGWKLAEYLSMGKAILSIPLSNQLPVELEHSKNIFIVEDSAEAVFGGLHYLIKNPGLRKDMEMESLKYWDRYVKPTAVIDYILKKTTQLNHGKLHN